MDEVFRKVLEKLSFPVSWMGFAKNWDHLFVLQVGIPSEMDGSCKFSVLLGIPAFHKK